MPSDQTNEYRVVLLGPGGVGKTSIVLRFVRGSFRDVYQPTIEDTYRQVVSCNTKQHVCTLQITDTTGSHQFPAMQRLSISKAHAFLLVFSLTDQQSFAALPPLLHDIHRLKIQQWEQQQQQQQQSQKIQGATEHRQLEQSSKEGSAMNSTNIDLHHQQHHQQQQQAVQEHYEFRCPVMLVGNKCDDVEQREVDRLEVERLATDWNCRFIETSAKENLNLKETFEQLLQMETRSHLMSFSKSSGGGGATSSADVASTSSFLSSSLKSSLRRRKSAKSHASSPAAVDSRTHKCCII